MAWFSNTMKPEGGKGYLPQILRTKIGRKTKQRISLSRWEKLSQGKMVINI